MFAIVGASGKVGHSTSSALRKAGVPVRAILRDEAKADRLSAMGCDIALADLQDPVALGRAIENADTVQVILPPDLRAEDAVGDMRRTIDSLATALEQSRPSRVLAISDYGAHIGEGVGMPVLFHLFEHRLRQLGIPTVLLRSAEHMEGWGTFVPLAAATGVLPSFHHPVDKPFPNVSAHDVGEVAAELLLHPNPNPDAGERIVHVEGPSRYSANDVAAALSQLLGRAIVAQAVPRSDWMQSLGRVVSPSATQLLVALYDAHNHGGLIDVEAGKGEVRRGQTELIEALRRFVPARE